MKPHSYYFVSTQKCRGCANPPKPRRMVILDTYVERAERHFWTSQIRNGFKFHNIKKFWAFKRRQHAPGKLGMCETHARTGTAALPRARTHTQMPGLPAGTPAMPSQLPFVAPSIWLMSPEKSWNDSVASASFSSSAPIYCATVSNKS